MSRHTFRMVVAAAALVAVTSPTVAGTQAAQRLPPGAIAVSPCSGAPLYAPAALPPAGSPPFLWIIDLCFSQQRGAARVQVDTYLSHIRLRPSRPSERQFLPWDETAEQRALADRRALVEEARLLEDMAIRVDEHVFADGVIGIIVTYDMKEREPVDVVPQ